MPSEKKGIDYSTIKYALHFIVYGGKLCATVFLA